MSINLTNLNFDVKKKNFKSIKITEVKKTERRLAVMRIESYIQMQQLYPSKNTVKATNKAVSNF